MRRGIFRLFPIVLVGLLLFDVVVDSASACDSGIPGAEACHACSCGPHMASPAVAEPAEAIPDHPATPPPDVSYSLILPHAIFHPPKPLV